MVIFMMEILRKERETVLVNIHIKLLEQLHKELIKMMNEKVMIYSKKKKNLLLNQQQQQLAN